MSRTAREFVQFYKITNLDDLKAHSHHVDGKHASYYTDSSIKAAFEAEYGYVGDSQETLLYMKSLGLKPMQYGGAAIPDMDDIHGHDIYLQSPERDGADLEGHQVSRMNAHYYKDSSKMTEFEVTFGNMGESRETYAYMEAHGLQPMHYNDPAIPSLKNPHAHDVYLPAPSRDGGELKGHEVTRMNAHYYKDSSKMTEFEITHGGMGDSAETIAYMKANGLLTWAPTTSANAKIPGFDGVEVRDGELLDLIEAYDAVPTTPIAREMVEARLAARKKAEASPQTPELARKETATYTKARRKLFDDEGDANPRNQSSDAVASMLKSAKPSSVTAERKLPATPGHTSEVVVTTDLDETDEAALDYAASAPERMEGFVEILRTIQAKKAALQTGESFFYDIALNFLLGRLDILNQSASGLDKDIDAQITAHNEELDDLDSEAREDALANPGDPLRPFNFGKESEINFFAGTEKVQEVDALELLISALLADNATEHFAKLQEAMARYYDEDIVLFSTDGLFDDDSEASEAHREELLPAQMNEFQALLAKMKEDKKAAADDAHLSEAYNVAESFLLGKIGALFTSMLDMQLKPSSVNGDMLLKISELDAKRGDFDKGQMTMEDPATHSAAAYIAGRIATQNFIKEEIFEQDLSEKDRFVDIRINALEQLVVSLGAKELGTYANTEADLGVTAALLALRNTLEHLGATESAEPAAKRAQTILEELQAGENAATVQKKLFDDDDEAAAGNSHLFKEDGDDRDMSSAESADGSDAGSPDHLSRVAFTLDADSGKITWIDEGSRNKHFTKRAGDRDDVDSDDSSDDGLISLTATSSGNAPGNNGDESDNGSIADDEDGGSSPHYQTLGASALGSIATHPAFSEMRTTLQESVIEYELPVITISNSGSSNVHIVPKNFNPEEYDMPERPPSLPARQDGKFLTVPRIDLDGQVVDNMGAAYENFDNVDFV